MGAAIRSSPSIFNRRLGCRMITNRDRIKYEYHTDASILGTKLIGGLLDIVLRQSLDKQVNNSERSKL